MFLFNCYHATLVFLKCKNFTKSVNRSLPSCSCVQHKSPCCGRSWGLPAGCHTQRAVWSSHADAGTGSDGTAGWAPSPAGADIQDSQHPSGPSAEADTRDGMSGKILDTPPSTSLCSHVKSVVWIYAILFIQIFKMCFFYDKIDWKWSLTAFNNFRKSFVDKGISTSIMITNRTIHSWIKYNGVIDDPIRPI